MIKALKRAHPLVVFTYFAGTAFTSSIQPASLDDGSADDMFMPVVFLS